MTGLLRRRLLAGAGAALGASIAGCLGDGAEPTDGGSDDESGGGSDGSPAEPSTSPLEVWTPAATATPLFVEYADLADVRQHESALRADTLEEIPLRPREPAASVIDELTDGDPALESVLAFGPEPAEGAQVIAGECDPDRLADREPDDVVDGYDVYAGEEPSIAVSSETVIVATGGGPTLGDVLDAGLDGVDRRTATDDRLELLFEHLGDATFSWMERAERDEVAGLSWSLEGDAASLAAVAEADEVENVEEYFETEFGDELDDVSRVPEGDAVVATAAVPIDEFEYENLFGDRDEPGQEAQAGVSIDVDPEAREVAVMVTAMGNADRVEVYDHDNDRNAELSSVGEMATLEYDAGASGRVQVIAVAGETRTVVASDSFEF
ncbi:hypothetical protein [Natrarchaeobius oligotrophus]|uniref:Uncharacterized protein n=1 Tax=Natrarchaeobius chitinivorans TaxID=1679083 RepID=A0A3N6MGN0_NATCH|nr:hypothetical protein [Natrarchaeobius chitinivorans]RQH03149.1 hypothetical protein EA472_00700 [Natrarchaeobius chitinivorans]